MERHRLTAQSTPSASTDSIPSPANLGNEPKETEQNDGDEMYTKEFNSNDDLSGE